MGTVRMDLKLSTNYPVVSPIGRLPDETLLEIVKTTLNTLQGDNTICLVSISSISRRFREVATACPTIWADIHVQRSKTSGPPRCYPTSDEIERISLWLNRSKNVPLTITHMISGEAPLEFDRHQFVHYLKVLLKHKDRWQSCKFLLPLDYVRTLGTVLERQHLPLLRHISILCYSRRASPDQTSISEPNLDIYAPAVHSIEQHGMKLHILSPLVNLTSLKIRGFSTSRNPTPLQTLLSTITACPSLSRLTLHGIYLSSTLFQDPPTPTIVTSKLIKFLSINFVQGSTEVVTFLASLSLPALEVFELISMRPPVQIPIYRGMPTALRGQLTFPALRTVKLYQCGYHDEPKRTSYFLESFPSVTTLYLRDNLSPFAIPPLVQKITMISFNDTELRQVLLINEAITKGSSMRIQIPKHNDRSASKARAAIKNNAEVVELDADSGLLHGTGWNKITIMIEKFARMSRRMRLRMF